MALFPPTTIKAASWPISLGAEGIAAAQFARCGFDVLVQAGRDKSYYDLVVSCGGTLLKVAVKASDNGRWCLTSGYTRRVSESGGMRMDCNAGIDMWRSSYGSRTVVCLVQFEAVAISEMPRIYLASPDEIAAKMREAAERTGECALCERYEWMDRNGECSKELLPARWSFSPERIRELLLPPGAAMGARRAAVADALGELALGI
jgi:hypothetical protein